MRNDNIEVKTNIHPIRATYTTDSMRKVRDEETGKVEVKRWVEERQVAVSIAQAGDRLFFKGAAL